MIPLIRIQMLQHQVRSGCPADTVVLHSLYSYKPIDFNEFRRVFIYLKLHCETYSASEGSFCSGIHFISREDQNLRLGQWRMTGSFSNEFKATYCVKSK